MSATFSIGRLQSLWPGVVAAATAALAASFVSTAHGGPQMLYALFFGLALHPLVQGGKAEPGVAFSASTVLRWGVGLLGARITATQIVALGWHTAAVLVLAVLATLALALLLGRRLGLSAAQSTLAGGAVAICGASAALAISAVLPRQRDSERYTLMVVVSVTLLSTVAMVLYPLLVRFLALPPALGGLFLGGTIHDVAQVVGAGYTINGATGDAATVVKLLRVALLTVVVAGVSLAFRDQRQQASTTITRPPMLPWFLWLFIAMVTLNSVWDEPAWLQQGLSALSRGCLVLAIAALGMKTSFADLRELGWRPVALIVAETLWLAAFVLVAVLLLR